MVTNTGHLAVPSSTIDFIAADGFGDSTVGEVPPLAGGRSQTVLTSFTPGRRGVSGIESVLITVAGPFGLVTAKKKVLGSFPIAVAVPTLGARIPANRRTGPPASTRGRSAPGTPPATSTPGSTCPATTSGTCTGRRPRSPGELMVRHEAEEETLHALIVIDLDRPEQAPDELETEFLIAAAAPPASPSSAPTTRSASSLRDTRSGSAGRRTSTDCACSPRSSNPGGPRPPAHDDPNHVVICAADDSRAEAMAAHFSRRIPITVRGLSEIDDMTMLGLSEDLPESWTTFETKRVIR